MEPNIFRYIWVHTRRDQVLIVLIVLLSMIPYYLAFDLPKQIINGPITGAGFDSAGATQPFMAISFELPLIGGTVHLTDGIPLERLPLLTALSLTFLGLVIVNGLFKYFINTYKGRLGERLLRRIRYELVDRILRFPPTRFKHLKAGEVSSMVKDEIEPLGGFAADAFTQPALLGGQAVTALVFIFIQHFWLGAVAFVMAVIQVAIIPRMRRRLIRLGRERQLTARELAGRVAEIVDGIQSIHAYDTTNYERADIASRLGRIFRIRYDIYQWKFMVKFLNNFIAQLTPFFFYSIGGYFTIKGALDVGQLVAVIAAYKELPGPMKELIDWDLARQDMQVKYEQVVGQFEAEDMIDPKRHAIDAAVPDGPFTPLVLQGLTVNSDLGSAVLKDVSLEVHQGETLAIIGGSADGAPVLGEVLGGFVRPSFGRFALGAHETGGLPEGLTGRVLGYAGPAGYFFPGSILDNIVYGLKRRPGDDGAEPDKARYGRTWRRREARRAGNPEFDLSSDWTDYESIQPFSGPDGLIPAVCRLLAVVELDSDIIDIAFRSVIDVKARPQMAEKVLEMRRALRKRLAERDLASLVLPFEPGRYNAEATIGENLFFGVPTDPNSSVRAIVRHPFFGEYLVRIGLDVTLYELGWDFAFATVDIFRGMAGNPEMLQQLTYMTPDELPEYDQILARTGRGGFAAAAADDRSRLIQLALSYIEPRYRFGLLDDKLRERLVGARHGLSQDMPSELRPQVQPYDPDHYLSTATLLENILFGKVNQRFGNADEKVRAIGRELLAERDDLHEQLIAVGAEYNVGPAGRRLSQLQRQKLGLVRTLIRKSAFYIMNEPLAGTDAHLQDRIIASVLSFLAEQPQSPGVVWVLANETLAHHFRRTAEFSQGRLVGRPAAADSRKSLAVRTAQAAS
jgi:putative ABC transport system ATP-binding protein